MLEQTKSKKKKTIGYYEDNNRYLAAELHKLDLLLGLRVLQFNRAMREIREQTTDRSCYISPGEIELLLQAPQTDSKPDPDLKNLYDRLNRLQAQITERVQQSLDQGIFLPLPRLANLFNLSPFEQQTVLVCLAPELHRKYDRIYGYLQDDLTRKRPSVDLVSRLLCNTLEERWATYSLFSDNANLFRTGILRIQEDNRYPGESGGRSRFLKMDQRMISYLLDNNNLRWYSDNLQFIPPDLSLDQVLVEPAVKSELLNLIEFGFSKQNKTSKRFLIYLHGPYGVGKQNLAQGVCNHLGCSMLFLDLETLEAGFETTLQQTFREGLLQQAALYLDHVDLWLDKDSGSKILLKRLAQYSAEYGWLTFMAGEKPWTCERDFAGVLFQELKLDLPNVSLREAAWEKALRDGENTARAGWAAFLARQFRLTPKQIRDAVAVVHNRQIMAARPGQITLADLCLACRMQSNQKLKDLALKIEPCFQWNDMVLPEDKLLHLKEICNQVKHFYRVFSAWGFERKISHGRGLSVLFSGPPGTGKTMAAQVMAHELSLDLYKIDLSGVVSKYIGETEKNLSRIFAEAETGNAILFFDEADALFGKRTQVSDAHDRYANIETSYLLQKMEEYEGMVILATNLHENMDEAFTRRIRFVVEFPFPDQQSRMEIWRTHFPSLAPLADGIDYDFLAKHFQISGGHIRNIILNAAFLASEKDDRIRMEHILGSARREFEKIGKLWDEKTFKCFFDPEKHKIEKT